jgi:hypothetical protein
MRLARTLMALQPQKRLNPFVRTFAVKAPQDMTEGEKHIFDILNDKLDPGSLTVQDVSGMALFFTLKDFDRLTAHSRRLWRVLSSPGIQQGVQGNDLD